MSGTAPALHERNIAGTKAVEPNEIGALRFAEAAAEMRASQHTLHKLGIACVPLTAPAF